MIQGVGSPGGINYSGPGVVLKGLFTCLGQKEKAGGNTPAG